MAQQPNSYKKFVATAATATLVASALVPVAASAASTFTDVPASYTDAVDYLVSKGANGLSATKFGISNEIKRGDAAVLLAGALGLADEKAPASGFSDVPARAATAINSLKAAGIINGKTATSFGWGDNLKRGEVALMLTKAYNLKGDASKLVFTDVKASYADAVAALVEAKVTSGISATKFGTDNNIKRGDFAKFAFALKTPVVTTATKVETVSATNLVEVEVKFDGSVDADSATNEDNYSLASGTVDYVELLEDGKTVRLTLTEKISNQVGNKLSVSNVKAGDKVVSVTDFAFTPIDNTLPTVVEVKNLGTKAVKVLFSEPVAKAAVGNFSIDGKPYYGSVDEGSREVILTPYDSNTLSVGEHTITVSGVEDYFGLKALSSEHKFTVVEDKVAPTVGGVDATLEKAVVTFSEEVDPTTVHATNVYWKQGDTKRYANGTAKKLASDKYEFSFTTNPLPAFETTLYVEAVKDYSGNTITETAVKVTAKVDQVRPEVTEVKADSSNAKNITVKFSKAVNAADKKYFTVLDKDGKVQTISEVKVADGSNQVFTVVLYNDLKQGQNTIKIAGVKDKTALENTMLDHQSVIGVKDSSAPTIVGVPSASNSSRSVMITFSEQMDLASIAAHGNYLINWSPDGVSLPTLRQLPDGTQVTPVQNGKAVLITFPEKLGNTLINFPQVATSTAGTVKGIQVMGVKDASNNILSGYSVYKDISVVPAALVAYGDGVTKNAVFTDKTTVKVKFDQAIGSANASDFTTTLGVAIQSATADASNVVTLKLASSVGTTIADNTISVKASNNMKTVNGNTVVPAGAAFTIEDEVKPEVELLATQSKLFSTGNTIHLPFSEALTTDTNKIALFENDLIVTNLATGKAVTLDRIATTLSADGKTINIAITPVAGEVGEYSVKVKSGAQYIQDTATNSAVESATYETARGAVNGVAPTISTVSALDISADGNIDTLKVTFSKAVQDSSLVIGNFGGYTVAGKASVTGDVADDNVLYLTVTGVTGTGAQSSKLLVTTAGAIKDLAGNLIAVDATGVAVTDAAAAAVTSKIAASATLTANATHTLVFSEALDAASLASVKAAVDAAYNKGTGTGTITSAWGADNKTLTVTITAAAAPNDVVFSAIANIVVKDVAGNTSGALVVQTP